MKCRVEKSEIDGDIVCPPNKSYTHRAIFMASLAIDKSIIKNILRSEDTQATIDTCKNFGVEISDVGNDITVTSANELKIKEDIIDAANSGTTIRIAAVIASLADDKITLTIKDFNNFVSKDKRVEKIIVPLGDGMTVCRKL